MAVFPQAFGRYLLKEPLALGGMAELFLAETVSDHGFAKTVVIKRILPHLAADQQFRSMFINEAKITAQLAHPKIAQTFELGTVDDQLFIVMEYIDGVDVLAILRESARRKTTIPEELAVYVMTEVLDALDFAHGLTDVSGTPKGIVHRDVSPSNVLLSKRGDVKLVDFGIACAVAKDEKLSGGLLKGKYGYMSPEQVNFEELSARSDIFSAGVVLAEMLMGKRLFVGSSELDVLIMVRDANLIRLEHLGRKIEPELKDIVRRALCKKQSDRYQSAVEFRDSLYDWLFKQRKRVTNSDLAELVNSFYESARAEREKSLEQAVPAAGGTARLPREAPPAAPGAPRARVLALPVGGLNKVLEGRDLGRSTGEQDPAAETHDTYEDTDYEELEVAEGIELPDRDGVGAESSSITLMAPDPTSRDFDESSIAGIKPRPSRILPSQEAKSPAPLQAESARASEALGPSGTLAETSALATLIRLSVECQSGTLKVTRRKRCKEVFLKKGVPKVVSSNDPRDLFGAFLVREKCVTSIELAFALQVMPRFNGQLGDALVGLGLMTPLDVFGALTSQVRARLVDVCTWTEGEFTWLDGQSLDEPSFKLDLDPFEAYGAGAMATPRESIESWLAERGQLRPGINDSNPLPPDRFHVGPAAHNYLDSTDGTKTVQDIVAASSPDDEGLQGLRMLFLLLSAGLLTDNPV